MNRFPKFVVALCFVVIFVGGNAAALSYTDWLETVPDNAGVRMQLADVILAPLQELSQRRARVYNSSVEPRAVRFEVSLNKTAGFTYLQFLNGENGAYPVDGAGSVIIRRNNRDGSFSRVKIFLKRDPAIYLRVDPSLGGSLLGVYLMDDDHPLYQNLHLPVTIQQAAVMSIRQLLEISDGRVGWDSVLDIPSAYYFGNVNFMIDEIRKALPTLPDADDGAMDDDGNLVRIATLGLNKQPGFNCSGFVKWIADGLYKPLTGFWLKIDDLKRKQFEARGDKQTEDYEESRDPFFGLDWTRNIAAKLAEARGQATRKIGFAAQDRQLVKSSGTISQTSASYQNGVSIRPEETWDVRDAPFNAYVEDKGFPVKDLKTVLYTLALKDPDYFYLAAVNGNWGSQPALWQYYHIVAIFPRITDNGKFEAVVFERNVESSVDSLLRRYPNEYVHLVRIKASKDFQAPVIQ